jgi:hypothetical protein
MRASHLILAAGFALGLSLSAHAADDFWSNSAGDYRNATTGEAKFDPSASVSTWEFTWTPGVATTVLPPAQILAGAKSICFHMKGSGTCYWAPGASNIDPATLTTNGAMGEEFAPGDYRCYDVRSERFLTASRAACTAATTSTAGLKTRQWK